MNTKSPICPECGKPVPTSNLGGLCPECMMKVGLVRETGEAGPGGTVAAKPAVAAPSVDEVAKLFPQLEILGLLGSGGMGAIYKARQPRLDRLVALKILLRNREDEVRDAHFTERFEREARALAKLSHPNIVAMYEFGQVGTAPYFIMEFVDGLNLRQLERAGKLSPSEAMQIIPQICEALQFAHDAGVVHRDIKPENILVDQKGRVKIADFGIAKILGRESRGPALTEGEQVIGTPHYMAPEQVETPQTVDHRADIYSLGVVFYEMLTGELPLGKFAPPSKTVQVDVRLDEVVLHALEKRRELRYQQARQVKTDVETIGASPAAATAPSAAEVGASNPWQQPAILLVGGLVGLILLWAGMVLPSPVNWLAFLFAAFALVTAVLKLAGLWPFPSGLFPRSNFTRRNLRSGRRTGVTAVLAGSGLLLAFAIAITGGLNRGKEVNSGFRTGSGMGFGDAQGGQSNVSHFASAVRTVTNQVEATSTRQPPTRTLFERVSLLPPLTPQQIGDYVQRNKGSAESLLAAWRASGDKAWLSEAASRFPKNADVQYAVIATHLFPEAQRQWIESYKSAAPDNALAWYFSAQDYLKTGDTARAVEELTQASRKPEFRSQLAATIQALEELNLSGGRSSDEAKVAAFQSCAQAPELPGLRDLAKGMKDLVEQYRNQGETASAESLLGMGLVLGAHLSDGYGSQTLINQLVGMAIQKSFLQQLDPSATVDPFGRPVTNLTSAINQRQAALKEYAALMRSLLSSLEDPEWSIYMERVKLYGEEAALSWLKEKHGR